jgi:acetylornithine aminotransferase
MRAGLETLRIIEAESLMANAVEQGDRIRAGLKGELGSLRGVREIRGRGLMIGIELDRPCGELVRGALDAGLLINVTHDNVIRLLPPLVITRSDADLVVERLAPLVARFLAAPAKAA